MTLKTAGAKYYLHNGAVTNILMKYFQPHWLLQQITFTWLLEVKVKFVIKY